MHQEQVLGSSPQTLKVVKSVERFISLDVFRGLTICLMIIVNSPGKGASMYVFLSHAEWFGFTLADLIFPSFLFAVGNAMSFSVPKMLETPGIVVWRKALTRSLYIFLLGYLMYWFPFMEQSPSGSWNLKPIAETRIMGVLQRIALCYGIAALIVYHFKGRGVVLISALVLLGYWIILFMAGDQGQELTLEGNAIRKLDLLMLGEHHLYKRNHVPFDPEGILSTLPAIVNVLAGYLVGIYLKKIGKNIEGIMKLVMIGLIITLVALFWELALPFSKKLWTSSFTLLTIGINVAAIAMMVYVIEVKGWKKGICFFDTFGKNPLFIYLFSELVYIALNIIQVSPDTSMYRWLSLEIFQKIFPGSFGSFVTATVFMLFCWVVAWWMDKKRIYIRV